MIRSKKVIGILCLGLALGSLVVCNSSKVSNTSLGISAQASEGKDEKNEPAKFEEKELKNSDIPTKYTLEQSKANNDYIFITDEDAILNKDKVEEFLASFANKKAAKIRYTQFYKGSLDCMRDIEYDGTKIILKDYDTKSPEDKIYKYLESVDNDMINDGGNYRLKNIGVKLFYVKNK